MVHVRLLHFTAALSADDWIHSRRYNRIERIVLPRPDTPVEPYCGRRVASDERCGHTSKEGDRCGDGHTVNLLKFGVVFSYTQQLHSASASSPWVCRLQVDDNRVR